MPLVLCIVVFWAVAVDAGWSRWLIDALLSVVYMVTNGRGGPVPAANRVNSRSLPGGGGA
jgi:hypothetical protein